MVARTAEACWLGHPTASSSGINRSLALEHSDLPKGHQAQIEACTQGHKQELTIECQLLTDQDVLLIHVR